MPNELDLVKTEIAVKAKDKDKLSDVIKPLVREIYLFDTFIAGTSYIDREILKELKINDKLTLQREQNKYDDKAIVLFNNQKKIGYIPEEDNIIFSRLMDAGKLLTAKIDSINLKGDWYKIRVKIYLMDI